MCFFVGYLLCPCTLGLSFMMPNQCIKDAESNLRNSLEYYNRHKFKNRSLRIKLMKRCSTSWIELRLTDSET